MINNHSKLIIPNGSSIQIGTTEIVNIVPCKELVDNCGDFFNSPEELMAENIKFLDLFWFLKPFDKTSESEIQLDLVTLGLNLQYGNMRINGYQNVAHAFHNQALFITRDDLTVNAAIYPSSLFDLLHLRNGERYRPVEQLYVRYNPTEEPWHDELATTDFQKQNDKLKMTITRGDEKYFYLFEDRQFEKFNYALEFVLSQGLEIVGIRK